MDANSKLRKILYKGVHIIHTDYTGLEGQEFLNQIERNVQILIGLVQSGESNFLQVIDFTGVSLPPDGYGKMRRLAIALAPHFKARAVVGITKSQKFLLNAINVFLDRKLRVFDTVEEAKEWLVEQARKP